MMTDAVHDLPLVVGEPSSAVEVLEDVIPMMDEVMSDTHHADKEQGATSSKEVGQPRFTFRIDTEGSEG